MFFQVNPFQRDTGPVDPLFALVAYLGLGENTPGSTTILDSSIHQNPQAGGGLATDYQNSASPIVFGNGSIQSVGNCPRYPNIAAYNIGTGDFALELQFRTTDVSAPLKVIFANGATTPVVGAWEFFQQGSSGTFQGLQFAYCSSGGTYGNVLGTGATPVISINTNHYITLARSGSTLAIGLDGVRLSSGSFSSDMYDSSTGISVGGNYSAGFPISGRIAARLTVGDSRGLTAATWTVPTVWPVQ